MPDDFMKQLQLSKQIEQKAREATKNRKIAEERLAEAEAELDKVKGKAGNATEAEELLSKANTAFKDKDYKNSQSLAENSIAASRARLVNWIEGRFGSTREIISVMQEMGADVAKASEVLSRISGALGKGDVDEAMLLTSEASVLAESLAHGTIEPLIAESRAEIEALGKVPIDVRKELESVERAEKALNELRFIDSVKDLHLGNSSLRGKFEKVVRKMVEDVKAIQALGAGTHADVTLANGELEDAIRHMEAHDVDASLKSIAHAETVAKDAVRKGIDDLLFSLSARVTKIEKVGTRANDITKKIDKAKGTLESGDLKNARGEAVKAESVLRDREIAIVTDAFSEHKVKLRIAKIMRIDLRSVGSEMDAAREAISHGDVESALKSTVKAGDELEKSMHGYQGAVSTLVEFKNALSKAEYLNIDVSKAQRTASLARKASLQRDFQGSAAMLAESTNDVHASIQAHYGRKVIDIEMDIAQALKMQGDVTLESEELDNIVSKIKSKEYDVIDDELTKLSESVDLLIRDIAERAIEESRRVLEEYDGPTDKSGPMHTIAEADTAMTGSRFGEAYEKALEAVSMLKREEGDLVESRFALADRLLAIMKELDCDSVMLIGKLSKAKDLSAAGDPAGAVRLADEVVHYSTSIIKDDIQKQMVKVRKAISIAKRKGVDVSDPDRTMKEAYDLLSQEKIEASYEMMQNGLDGLKERNRLHNDAYDLIADVRLLINEAYMKGIDVNRTETRLEGAQSLFESGKYVEAINAAMLAHHDVESKAAPLILPRLISECRDIFSLGRMMKVNTTKAESMLEIAERLHASGDHLKALAMVKESRDLVMALMADALSRDIAAARSTLEKGAESGKDIASIELMIEKADALLVDRQYNDSWRIVELVKSELDQATFVDTRASDYIGQAEDGLKDLTELGLNAVTAKEVLKQARLFQKQGNSMLATELAKKAFLIAAESAEGIIEERIAKAEGKAQLNGMASPEMSSVISIRQSIRNAISQHHFKDAMSILPSLERELDDAANNRELAKQAIARADDRMNEASKEESLPASFIELLAKSRLALSEGSFIEARALAERFLLELASLKTMKETRMKEIQSMREELSYLSEDDKRGAVVEMVDAAEEFLSKLDLERTSLHLRRARAALVEATGSEVGRRFEDLLHLYKIMDQFGIPKPPQERLNGQMKMNELRPKDLEKLRGEVAVVIAAATAGLNDHLKGVRLKVDSAGKQGKPVTASVKLLDKASSLISGEKFPEAIEAMKDAERFIGVSDDVLAKFASGQNELNGIMNKMMEAGIDVEEMSNRLSDLERSLPEDPEASIKGLTEVGNSIVSKLERSRPFIDINVDFLEQPNVGIWTKTLIKVLNNGGSKARNISVDIGKGIDVRGTSVIGELPAGESTFMRIEIMPRTRDNVTVKLTARCESDIDHKDLAFESEFEVKPKPLRSERKIIK